MSVPAVRAAYLCTLVAAGLVALHFNAERLPAWTRGLSLFSGAVALAGAVLASYALAARGWTKLENWPAQVALAANVLLGAGFLLYAL